MAKKNAGSRYPKRRIVEPPPPPPKPAGVVAAATPSTATIIPDGHELVEITAPGYSRIGLGTIAVGAIIAIPSGAVAGVCDVQEDVPGGHRIWGKRVKTKVRKKKEAKLAPEGE